MINLYVSIANPFRKFFNRDGSVHNYYYLDKPVSKNKTFEIQISRVNVYNLIDIGLNLNWNGSDHAGPELDITLLGFSFNVNLRDNRHWNHSTDRWETYPGEDD